MSAHRNSGLASRNCASGIIAGKTVKGDTVQQRQDMHEIDGNAAWELVWLRYKVAMLVG
jgi:hypothetical protein